MKDKKDIIESINHIKDSTRTIVDIISDVLTLEKLRTNEITIRPAYFMLIDLCQSCMLSMNQNAINKDINFVCENNVGSISIKGDYIRLKQVIINLISNSFKFTSNGGKVIFSINKEENNHKIFIKFSIKDNGIGIKKEHIDKIIELDVYLPYNSTFFCITNTQDLSFEYISKNLNACLGMDREDLKAKGMRYLWSKMHPDDLDVWLKALDELMNFTLKEVAVADRSKMNYTWNKKQLNSNTR